MMTNNKATKKARFIQSVVFSLLAANSQPPGVSTAASS
jgi:hypothetical protein